MPYDTATHMRWRLEELPSRAASRRDTGDRSESVGDIGVLTRFPDPVVAPLHGVPCELAALPYPPPLWRAAADLNSSSDGAWILVIPWPRCAGVAWVTTAPGDLGGHTPGVALPAFLAPEASLALLASASMAHVCSVCRYQATQQPIDFSQITGSGMTNNNTDCQRSMSAMHIPRSALLGSLPLKSREWRPQLRFRPC